MRPVKRNIYFYRAHVGTDGSGEPLPFDLTPALRNINSLPFLPTGRYLDDGDSRLCCWVDRADPEQRFRLGQIRRSDLPLVENQGNLQDLAIPQDSGLAEAIHVVLFQDNIVGSDFNFYGPRLSRLSHYLSAKASPWCPDVTFEPLLRQDVEDQLDRLQDIRLFHLKIRASYATIVAEADSDLGAAFGAAARAGSAQQLEIVLRPEKYSRDSLSRRMLDTVRRLIRRPDLRTEASKFQIKGVRSDTNAVEIVDVLRDQLITSKAIMRQSERGRALNKWAAYGAIEEAFDELKGDLISAAGVEP